MMIEKGRHSNLHKSERKCPFCPLVEDETHFLMICHIYTALRNDLIATIEEKLKDKSMVKTDTKLMTKYLLGNNEIAPLVAKYITKALELRDFLIDNPKRLI